MSRYFPLFISLKGKKITVVGAGTVAARRIRTLLAFEPELVVIAPEAAEEVQALADEGTICWEKREFAPGQIEGSLFVLAAADKSEVNLAVWEECRRLGIPVNRADDHESCDFYFPGIALAGELTAGVTAGGSDHRLAKEAAGELRKALTCLQERKEEEKRQRSYGNEYQTEKA